MLGSCSDPLVTLFGPVGQVLTLWCISKCATGWVGARRFVRLRISSREALAKGSRLNLANGTVIRTMFITVTCLMPRKERMLWKYVWLSISGCALGSVTL